MVLFGAFLQHSKTFFKNTEILATQAPYLITVSVVLLMRIEIAKIKIE